MIHQSQDICTPHSETDFRDRLTGLFTYGFFLAYLEQELHRFRRYGSPFTLAIAEIDAFEDLNRKHGVLQAERLLCTVARAILQSTRHVDIAARCAGDRFIVLFVGAGRENGLKAAERMKASVARDTEGQVTVSIGLATFTGDDSTGVEHIIRQSKEALSQAKIQGKDRICRYRPAEIKPKEDRSTILIVDDEPLNVKLMEGLLKPLGYSCCNAGNGADALCIINSSEIDLVLLDLMMPAMDGFEVCSIIKANEQTRMIPVILLTALDDKDSKIRGIEAGADDFITKPPHKLELLARVKSLLRLKRLNNNLTSMENVLFSMAKAVEAKDRYTQGHVDRVSELAIAIGRSMGLGPGELEALRFGGALHDIGKMGIPSNILNKPGPLSAPEWEIMKTHSEIGFTICQPLHRNLGQALDIVRSHHEKLDGSGYPKGLTARDISMPTRIMTIADIYDAMTTERPYRRAMSSQEALAIMVREAGEGKIDPHAVECLIRLVGGEKVTVHIRNGHNAASKQRL